MRLAAPWVPNVMLVEISRDPEIPRWTLVPSPYTAHARRARVPSARRRGGSPPGRAPRLRSWTPKGGGCLARQA